MIAGRSSRAVFQTGEISEAERSAEREILEMKLRELQKAAGKTRRR